MVYLKSTLYRQLGQVKKPKPIRRSDAGKPRSIPEEKMLQYCEIIAALKLRTTNKNGRHISTVTALDVLETTGIESEYGFVKLTMGELNKATVNRYLSLYGLDESNKMLSDYLVKYNDHQHRSEQHSRMDDWLQNIKGTIKKMCSWERYCAFAREPEKRKVGIDARISVDGSVYKIDPDLAGENVILWWGLFDDELYVEYDGNRYGAYFPISGPVPLYRYRKFKKTKVEQRLDKLEGLAKSLKLPEEGSDANSEIIVAMREFVAPAPSTAFIDSDPFNEVTYENTIKAKVAISKYLGKPLTLLSQGDRDIITSILAESLDKKIVMAKIKEYFTNTGDEQHAN